MQNYDKNSIKKIETGRSKTVAQIKYK